MRETHNINMIKFLLKFTEAQYLDDLIKGSIYINHSTFFTKKTDQTINDEKEGLSIIKHLGDSIIQVKFGNDEIWKDLNVKKGTFLGRNNLKNVHIYSLFHITEKDTLEMETYNIPNEIRSEKKWEYGVVIKRPDIFIQRMVQALNLLGYPHEYGKLEYYDEKIDQNDLTPFNKRVLYSYQKEFRFLINQGTKEAFRLEIGSIKDISEIFKVNEIAGFKFAFE